MSRYNLVSFVGLFVLMALAWALSTNRRKVNWHAVGWGLGLQLLFGLLVFCAPGSTRVFLHVNDFVLRVLEAATAGQRFVFGALAMGPGDKELNGALSVGFVLATQALPIVIFFSSLMAILYYAGVMQWVVRGFAWVFTRLMRVSGAESLCTAANIFAGIESVTTIRPFLARMTRSEYCLVLTAGMATVASSTMGIYVLFLKDVFPTVAGHLISASILSAPAAIIMAKLLVPEEGQPETLGVHVSVNYERESSLMEAIVNGASAGVQLVIGIIALLIAVLGLVALIDLALGWGIGPAATLKHLLGWLFAPLAAVIGVPWTDAVTVGSLLGERAVATEVPAYLRLAGLLKDHAIDPRSAMLSAYALCGYAHVASLAIFVGGVAALCPERRKDIAAVGPRALLAATLACLMTGAVAGVFYHGADMVLR